MVTKIGQTSSVLLKSMFSPSMNAMATHGNSAIPWPVALPSQLLNHLYIPHRLALNHGSIW